MMIIKYTLKNICLSNDYVSSVRASVVLEVAQEQTHVPHFGCAMRVDMWVTYTNTSVTVV